MCHSKALLTISGDPVRGLEWKVACEGSTRSIREAIAPNVRVVNPVEASETSDDLGATALRALETLGWKARQAEELLARARELLRLTGTTSTRIDVAALVNEACRIGVGCSRPPSPCLTLFQPCDSLRTQWSKRDTSMCHDCPLRRTCPSICELVELQLPSPEAGRVDHEDLARLHQGRIMAHALLDNLDALTERQRQVIELYFRENLQQVEIAAALGISQQAVGDSLARAKVAVGKKLKGYYSFF